MIPGLPTHISIIFMLTTLLTVAIFYRASQYSLTSLFIILGWLIIQLFIGLSGFYTVTDTIPPRFLLLIGVPLLFIILLFLTKKGKGFVDNLDLKTLTYLHTIRIPVELVLLWLCMNGQVSQLITFEGRNFDILSGITAPIVAYIAFRKKALPRKALLAWNIICLGLLINVVAHAILSVPTPFQQLSFDQPTVAVMYFPFVWLPCCVVPLVLFSHLVAIRQLIKK
jgi:hypothetical protein